MSQRRTPNNDNVQIRLDMRVLLIAGGILAAIVIFALAFAVGRIAAGGGTTTASQGGSASQSAVVSGQNPAAAAPGANSAAPSAGANPAAPSNKGPYQLGGNPSDPPIPVPPALQPISLADRPAGDAPRLALPELVASKYVYDFGEISPTEKVEKTFVLKNDGSKPLEIASVKSTCGCTAALVSDNTVPAGGQTTVKITFDPTTEQIAGTRVTREVKVATNDPLRPSASFHITAYVKPQ
ncbi:MAG: DUF1573 domain-containing protein [Anaerolineae bacterium]